MSEVNEEDLFADRAVSKTNPAGVSRAGIYREADRVYGRKLLIG